MENVYQAIDGSQYKRIFVVGDLHGCWLDLNEEMYKVQFDTQTDLLISVGDLIDRGTHNIECLELLNQPWFKAVLGNHEQMALDAVTAKPNTAEADMRFAHWFRNGGMWFVEQSVQDIDKTIELFHKVAQLPYLIEVTIDDKKVVIGHADYPSNTYTFGKPVDLTDVVWSRDRMVRNQNGRSVVITGADEFYFGHTPVKDPKQFKNQNYIDTGAVFGGRLTMVQIK